MPEKSLEGLELSILRDAIPELRETIKNTKWLIENHTSERATRQNLSELIELKIADFSESNWLLLENFLMKNYVELEDFDDNLKDFEKKIDKLEKLLNEHERDKIAINGFLSISKYLWGLIGVILVLFGLKIYIQ